MRVLPIAAVMMLVAFGASSALADNLVLELTHEAVPGLLDLPRNVNGELVVRACTACKTTRLRASVETRYFIGEQEVTLVDLTKYFDSHPMALVTVVQPRQEAVVSRVVASATAPAK